MSTNRNNGQQHDYQTAPLIRWRLFPGTIRRFFWYHFRPAYTRAQTAKRSGKCQRCGACCQLAWRCPFFRFKDGMPSCAIYKWFRFRNCSMFPISKHDLDERNVVSPHTPCGYSWKDEDPASAEEIKVRKAI